MNIVAKTYNQTNRVEGIILKADTYSDEIILSHLVQAIAVQSKIIIQEDDGAFVFTFGEHKNKEEPSDE